MNHAIRALVIAALLWSQAASLKHVNFSRSSEISLTHVIINSPSAFEIPKQIITTGWPEHFQQLEQADKDNVMNTLEKNQGFKLRYLGDLACHDYLKKFFPRSPLKDFYKQEKDGRLRGDICRAAVLLREGGHYVDLDVEMEMSFAEVMAGVDFASVKSPWGYFNGIQAGPANHPILQLSFESLEEHYKTQGVGKWPAGCLALTQGVGKFSSQCKGTELVTGEVVSCAEHKIRIMKELDCHNAATGCPPDRVDDHFGGGHQFGIYTGHELFAWSRFRVHQHVPNSHWFFYEAGPETLLIEGS